MWAKCQITRPGPGVYAFCELVEGWRNVARTSSSDAYANALEMCADEVEAALVHLSGPVDASGEPNSPLVEALKDAVQTARHYYMLWHDDTWKERLSKWEAALAAAAVPSSPAQADPSNWDDYGLPLPPSSPVADIYNCGTCGATNIQAECVAMMHSVGNNICGPVRKASAPSPSARAKESK